jgi:hypothetical protein
VLVEEAALKSIAEVGDSKRFPVSPIVLYKQKQQMGHIAQRVVVRASELGGAIDDNSVVVSKRECDQKYCLKTTTVLWGLELGAEILGVDGLLALQSNEIDVVPHVKRIVAAVVHETSSNTSIEIRVWLPTAIVSDAVAKKQAAKKRAAEKEDAGDDTVDAADAGEDSCEEDSSTASGQQPPHATAQANGPVGYRLTRKAVLGALATREKSLAAIDHGTRPWSASMWVGKKAELGILEATLETDEELSESERAILTRKIAKLVASLEMQQYVKDAQQLVDTINGLRAQVNAARANSEPAPAAAAAAGLDVGDELGMAVPVQLPSLERPLRPPDPPVFPFLFKALHLGMRRASFTQKIFFSQTRIAAIENSRQRSDRVIDLTVNQVSSVVVLVFFILPLTHIQIDHTYRL